MKELYLEKINSTNLYAKLHIDEIDDMTLVYTYNQTNGHGRLKRRWNNIGSDNIYASIVLKPSTEMKEVYANLTQYLCVILAKTFEEYGVKPSIKWPNDILINNKKISGILAESVLDGNLLKGLVIGVGINLNSSIDELKNINQPATSLNIETGKFVDKQKFLKTLTDKFSLLYDSFIERGFSLIKEDYLIRVNFINKQIIVKSFDKEIHGIAKDITEKGELKIIDDSNKEQILYIGDIL